MDILMAPILVDALLDQSADLGVALLPNDHPQTWFGAQLRLRIRVGRAIWPQAREEAHCDSGGPRGRARDRLATGHPTGQAPVRAYGREAASLEVYFQVRSSTAACWQAQAGDGVAGPTFSRPGVRPLQTRERLPVALLRNRFRPPSLVQEDFCEAFDTVWKQQMTG